MSANDDNALSAMAGFTPGPWNEKQSNPDLRITDVSFDGRGSGVWSSATIYSSDQTKICEHESNVRLIAAAPDLLEALRDMVSDHADLSAATLDFARAAIAKAEGRA